MTSGSSRFPGCHCIGSKNGVQLSVRERNVNGKADEVKPVAVLVHQYSLLGGSQQLMQGLATELNAVGFSCVTFDMRGVGGSTGHATITGQSEVNDVVAVCKWTAQKYKKKILLVGSSAGAPIAGSALDHVDEIESYVAVGYTFGFWSSLLFGSHYKAVLTSPKPKFFIMGSTDGFTPLKTFWEKMKIAAGETKWELIPNIGHFELEGPEYDKVLAQKIAEYWEKKIGTGSGSN